MINTCFLLTWIKAYAINSKHFVERMRDMSIGEDEMLVSFDGSSLFTNVPVDEAVHVIHDKPKEDRTLEDRTNLTPVRVAELGSEVEWLPWYLYPLLFLPQGLRRDPGRMDPLLDVDQGEGHTDHGEAIQGCTRFPAVVARSTFGSR